MKPGLNPLCYVAADGVGAKSLTAESRLQPLLVLVFQRKNDVCCGHVCACIFYVKTSAARHCVVYNAMAVLRMQPNGLLMVLLFFNGPGLAPGAFAGVVTC